MRGWNGSCMPVVMAQREVTIWPCFTREGWDWQANHSHPTWLARECNHSRHLVQMRSPSSHATAEVVNPITTSFSLHSLCPVPIPVLLSLLCSVPRAGWALGAVPCGIPCWQPWQKGGEKKVVRPSSLAHWTSAESALALLGLTRLSICSERCGQDNSECCFLWPSWHTGIFPQWHS